MAPDTKRRCSGCRPTFLLVSRVFCSQGSIYRLCDLYFVVILELLPPPKKASIPFFSELVYHTSYCSTMLRTNRMTSMAPSPFRNSISTPTTLANHKSVIQGNKKNSAACDVSDIVVMATVIPFDERTNARNGKLPNPHQKKEKKEQKLEIKLKSTVDVSHLFAVATVFRRVGNASQRTLSSNQRQPHKPQPRHESR